jgi:hypothetical protein
VPSALVKHDQAPSYQEVPAQHFDAAVSKVPQGHIDQDRHYEGARTFLSHRGTSGYAIAHNGEIKYVFSTEKGHGAHALNHALQQGGTHLNTFEGPVAQRFRSLGFKDFKREANWTPGGPDVVWLHKSDDFRIASPQPNLLGTKDAHMANPTRKEIAQKLLTGLRGVLTRHEEQLRKAQAAESTGRAQLIPSLRKAADLWNPEKDEAGKVRGSEIARQKGEPPKKEPIKKDPKSVRGMALSEPFQKTAACLEKGCADGLHKCGDVSVEKAEPQVIQAPKSRSAAGVRGASSEASIIPSAAANAAIQARSRLGKDEFSDVESQEASCPACSGAGNHIGTLGARDHFICRGCGIGFSSPRAENAAASVEANQDDPMMGKGEPSPDGYIDVKHQGNPDKRIVGESGEGLKDLPKGPGKKVEAEGSGGETSKGKMAKANPAVDLAAGVVPKGGLKPAPRRGVALPGMTPPPGAAPQKSFLAGLLERHGNAPTSAAQANQEIGGFQSIASNPTAMPGGTMAPTVKKNDGLFDEPPVMKAALGTGVPAAPKPPKMPKATGDAMPQTPGAHNLGVQSSGVAGGGAEAKPKTDKPA